MESGNQNQSNVFIVRILFDMFQTSVDDFGMAVIVGLLVILTTSLVASPQDTDAASLPISALSLPPTQHPPVNTKTNATTSSSTEPQTNLSLQSNVSQTDYISHTFTETTATPIQESDTSDITTVAVTTTASEKIATTTDVSSPDTTAITQPSQTTTPTTVSPDTTTTSTPSFTTPHTVVTSTSTTSRTTIVTTSPSAPKTTSDINATTTSSPPPSSVSPATTPTTSVPQTSPTTSPSAPHHTGASIALTLFILVAVILLIGAVS